jgi:hypothetical protein
MTRSVPDGKRYSPFDAAEVHADMRADPDTTWRNAAWQPHVLAKHQDCAECAELRPMTRPVTSRRARLEFSMPELADRLGLPAGMRIVRMSVVDDLLLLPDSGGRRPGRGARRPANPAGTADGH